MIYRYIKNDKYTIVHTAGFLDTKIFCKYTGFTKLYTQLIRYQVSKSLWLKFNNSLKNGFVVFIQMWSI